MSENRTALCIKSTSYGFLITYEFKCGNKYSYKVDKPYEYQEGQNLSYEIYSENNHTMIIGKKDFKEFFKDIEEQRNDNLNKILSD